jgi:hypothetical protein
MREIGTKKWVPHIMNLHVKRSLIIINYGIDSLKKTNFQSHICQIEDKKTAYNQPQLTKNANNLKRLKTVEI